jgi:hypothetical protein
LPAWDQKKARFSYCVAPASSPPTNYAKAVTLVQEVDGLPLALDQAGAYIDETHTSLPGYLTLYRAQHARLLASRGERAFEHPAPVATTWSLSFQKVV